MTWLPKWFPTTPWKCSSGNERASLSHRGGEIGGGFFFTPAEGDGVVAIIDVESRTLHAAVRVEGATKVAYVGTRG